MNTWAWPFVHTLAKWRPQVASPVKRQMVLAQTPHPLSYYFNPKKRGIIFPPKCATICNDSFKCEYVTSSPVTYGGKCFIKEISFLDRRIFFFFRVEDSLFPEERTAHLLLAEVPAPRVRLILTSSWVLSCLLSAGCGGSPIPPLPIPFEKLGIRHISLATIWGRGESNPEVRFHNRSKGRECVRKRVPPQSESEEGRRAWWGHHSGCVICVTEGDRASVPCAGDCARHCSLTWGSAGRCAGSSLRKPCPTKQHCQVLAGQTKENCPGLNTHYSPLQRDTAEAALPAALPRAWRLAVVADRFKHSPASWHLSGLTFYKSVPNLDRVKMQDSCLCR